MKALLIVIFVTTLVISCKQKTEVSQPSETESNEVKAIGNDITAKLMLTLKNELTTALESGGPVEAIKFCNIQALPLTIEVEASSMYPVEIKRTSFNFRNPKNAPDEFEEGALKYFNHKAVNGLELPEIYIQKISQGDKTFFYYYKPMKVVKLCLLCHGDASTMDSTLISVIDEKYPDDRARNYTEGDFRGLIRVKVELE